MAKKREDKIRTKKLIVILSKEFLFVILGIFISAFALKSFLIPNGFIDGGITGIALMISFLTPLSLSLVIFLLNIPFMFLAKKQVGFFFAIKTLVAISGVSLALIFINYPILTSDKLLVAVFGGFLLGAGVGISVRGGSVLDGTEVLSVYLSKKIGLSIGTIIFIINVIIFSFAFFFLGIENSLYSILTYLIASKTIDFFVQGVEEYIGITIISRKSEELRKKLTKELGKGVTVYHGRKGYSENQDENEMDILYTVVTRLEVTRVKREIELTDSEAVIIEHGVKNVKGGRIKKRPLN